MSAERRVGGIRKALAVTAAATGLAVTGLLGYEAIQPKQQPPEPTPIAGGIGMPTPTPTPEIKITPSQEVSPSPSPEVSPSPVPSASPEATPVPSIESVKLVSEGSAAMEIAGPPKGIFNIYDATVVALEKNPDGTVKDFAVTVGSGNKISRIGSNIFKDLYSYKGVTFWISVKDLTLLGDANSAPDWRQIGEGPTAVSKYIEVGKSVPEISMYFSSVPEKYAALNVPNNTTYAKLNESIGKTFPRSYRGFTFNASGIYVQP